VSPENFVKVGAMAIVALALVRVLAAKANARGILSLIG
jgi:hypothetical protein